MRTLVALLLLLSIAACGAVPATAPTRVAGVHDGSFTAPEAVASALVQIESVGQANLAALDSDGLVWLLNDGASWYQLAAGVAPFVSVAGTPQGRVYAVDAAGGVWRYQGGAVPWVAEPVPVP